MSESTDLETGTVDVPWVFPERLAATLKVRGLSQQKLADAIGTSQGHIAKWRSGDRRPRIEFAIKIAEALDVSMDYLFRGAPAPDPKERLSPSEMAAIEAMREMSPARLRETYRVIFGPASGTDDNAEGRG